MATYTITTANVNTDTLSGKTGGDTYNVNGTAASLIVDGHSRWDLNGGSTTGAMGNITLSAALGGTIKIRADATRLLAYNTGASTVPAPGTVISQGGASGKLLGVYTNLGSAPSTPGGAMPASGYILVKQWNAVAYSTGALTGISASVIADPVFGGTGRDGWIEVVFDEAKNMTLNRLNNTADDVAVGADFYLGITDGVRATTYQIPSNGSAQYIGGVQVETAPGSNVYEWWPTTSAPMTAYNVETTGERSQHCHLTPSTALIRFGHDGTNSTGGACPSAGRKVRIPNILLTNAPVAARNLNSFPATSTRYYFYPLGAGRLRLNNVSSAHRTNLWTTAYQIYLRDSSFCAPMMISQNASPADIDNICISTPVDDAVTSNSFGLTSSVAGGTVTDSVISGGYHTPAAKTAISTTGSDSWHFENVVITGNGMGAISTVNVSIATSDRITFNDCVLIGAVSLSGSNFISMTNFREVAKTAGAPAEGSGNPNFIALSNKCSNIFLDNWTFPHPETLCKGALFSTVGCSDVKVRNMGSYASPISGGEAPATATYTRSGATATFTKTGHGYRVNDFFYVTTVDATTGVSGLRTITSVPDANTFVTDATNSGATSGTVRGYRTFCSTVVYVAASGACSNIEFHNLFVDNAYTNSVNFPLVASNVKAFNVSGGIDALAAIASIDSVTRGIRSTLTAPSVTSAQYGHSFLDGEVLRLGPAIGSATWTRSAGVMTVTTSGPHLLEVPSRARLYNCSDSATQPNQWRSCTPKSPTTFTCTCAASGATSGTIDWDVPTDMLTVWMNEQSDALQRYTILAGTPAFTGAGTLSATTVGDEIEWEMPEPLINHTGFHNSPPNSALTETPTTMGAYRLTYDIALDGGAYSGTYKNLLLILASTSGTSGSPIISVSSTTDVGVGDSVWGIGIAQGATVVSVDSSTQLTLSANNTTTVTGGILFGHLPAETFTTDFKLKVRLLTTAANSTTIGYINIPLVSDATSRAQLYSQAASVPVTVTALDGNLNPIQNARIYIQAAAGGLETAGTALLTGLTDVNGVFSGTYNDYLADQPITGWTRKATGSPTYKQAQIGGTIESAGYETTVFLVKDE